MYCPRCGAEYEQGDRYCASCGATLPGSEPQARERRSLRDRAAALIGTTRNARLVTAVTVVTIAIAIVAFVALDTGGDGADAYTRAADQICVRSKKEIGAASRRSLAEDPTALPRRLVPIVARWRSELGSLRVPSERADAASALDTALRDVEVEAAELSRLAREGNRRALVEGAGELDESTRGVEDAISELDLERCARLRIAPGVAPPQNG